MVTRIQTVAFQGINTVPIDVQVQVANGLPAFNIVGLADKAVAESKERVRAALNASGLSLPPKRIVVNLAPADLPKEGSHYDLPIALGLMAAIGAISPDMANGYLVLGELALDGRISPVAGVLPTAIAAQSMELGLICPKVAGPEAAWAGGELDIVAPESLLALVNHLKGTQMCVRPQPKRQELGADLPDMADIKGQESAKRALEVAAAGAHNFLMVGPPGAGKSMLAARLPSILPPLNPRELLDVSMVQSVAGQLAGGQLSDRRPFRAPHHSASMAALVGGGLKVKPGEVSLAHNGILFLDELPEFSPQVIDSLRQPLESGETIIARANNRVTYPSQFQLVAAMNPCKCGMAGTPGHTCRRGARCAADYQARLSGPFLDRIDIRIDVPAVSALDMIDGGKSEPSEAIAKRVARARQLQHERFAQMGAVTTHTNARASADVIEKVVELKDNSKKLLVDAAEKFNLSARAYHRVLKVARTLADLDNQPQVERQHVAEALGYRLNFNLG
ncbi:YifB family Mg chelatase-like AAA ATPase [Maritalea myrionectae]|uniref:YifB family Mg chelatase-like AAA ATPase n=1 Tax=Maritalea myrionectae TaxID=454601 RepID=UPI0004166697|nr:YifB family Mg chelatase-like AAA ATPase [Maritalea myrionectae]